MQLTFTCCAIANFACKNDGTNISVFIQINRVVNSFSFIVRLGAGGIPPRRQERLLCERLCQREASRWRSLS